MTLTLRLALVLAVACSTTATTPKQPDPEKSSQINAPGAVVDIEKSLVPGYVTVIDFWADWCGACHEVGKMLDAGVAGERKILIRKVDVGADAFTPVAAAYQIGGLPHYRVYDKHGKMRYTLVGNDCTKASEIAKQLVAEP